MDNPYKNPLIAIDFNLPQDNKENSDTSAPNTSVSDFQWVQAETSLQWKFFRNTLKLLKKRKNKILVLIGPFNERMLSVESKDKYVILKNEIEKWLEKNSISYISPQPLSAELYNDASHPTSQGYNTLAKELVESIKPFIDNK
jgi:hypothetical protein